MGVVVEIIREKLEHGLFPNIEEPAFLFKILVSNNTSNSDLLNKFASAILKEINYKEIASEN